jgi:hypothetical protein
MGILAAILLAAAASLVGAQQSDSPRVRPAQVSFVYPFGTNGFDSLEYSNGFSLNAIFGLNGGVNGVELGSVFNFNRGDVRWAQLAGVFNINTGDTRGVQLAGVFNVNDGDTRGLQMSTANLAFQEFTGFQVGVVNYSRKLNGVQLGVVNITANSEGGVPIGLVNIVKGGHYELETTGGDVMYLNVNYKMGVEKFYTILKAGLSSFNGSSVYAAGIGFGGALHFGERQKLNIDVSTNSIVYDNNLPIDKTNILNKIDFNYKFELFPRFSLLIGPSFNIYVTEEVVDGKYNTLNVPYTLYSSASSGTNTSIWIGANAGLSYTF